ncbi:hypothetical protein [Nocardioides sp.]|uniref:sulfotransferase family protein n=1 Tax=Nocardioides sp. TaxID=35761 RepID=UPI000C8E71A6|nr:hypothetical protein [Nocardioides sp.]MAS54317.1 hypothetical protein [Pimelobacter sp.]MDE0775330.1 hypothetical protein [Nocardioides sp.]
MVKLLIVTGSGRSGTSSVAGTLKRFGFHIPQPEVATDDNNPRGYYEPLWVADFHKYWLNALPVRTIDTRPHAGDLAMASVTPEREEELRSWLAAELAPLQGAAEAVVVVKETRAYWVYPLWQRVAEATGAEVSSLTMLRHPTQVVRSRDSAYLADKSDELRRKREVANVAAWMNSIFVTERATRDNPRAFVPYYDLIGDWRAAMTRACGQLGLDPGDLTAPHDVDDFLTTSLNRSSDSWEGLAVPDDLRGQAEATWAAATTLVETPHDAAAMAELDRLAADYAAYFEVAAAIANDETAMHVVRTKRDHEGRLREKTKRVERQAARIKALEAEVASLRADPGAGRAKARIKGLLGRS